MSINSNMESCFLKEKVETRGDSGSIKESWSDTGKSIMVSIYSIDEININDSVKLKKCNHIGLTFYKDIKKGSKIIDSKNKQYKVIQAKPKGRLAQLYLEVLENERVL